MVPASELLSSLTYKMEIYIAVVNHTFGNISMVLLIKLIYEVPSKIPIKIYDNFPGFSWSLQETAEVVPGIMSVPLLSMSFPCHQSISFR
jgi:hypothetical protein